MINSFTHKGLERFYLTGDRSGIDPSHEQKLTLQLTALSSAKSQKDIMVPGWKAHPMKGKFRGYCSIKVNGNWRLTFRFTADGHVELVDYQDYH